MQVLDVKTMRVLASWRSRRARGRRASPTIAPPTDLRRVRQDVGGGGPCHGKNRGDDRERRRCGRPRVGPGGKAHLHTRGRDSSVTVVHEDTPDKYSVVATVATMRGAKTISVDPLKHVPICSSRNTARRPPRPRPRPGRSATAARARPPRGPVIGAWFFAISH